MSTDAIKASAEILNSWKEIANYLNRGVRTVQRWEGLGLPVRRPSGKNRSAVIAMRSEIDGWLYSRPLEKSEDTRALQAVSCELAVDLSTRQLVFVSRHLREDLKRHRSEHYSATMQLSNTIRNMTKSYGCATAAKKN